MLLEPNSLCKVLGSFEPMNLNPEPSYYIKERFLAFFMLGSKVHSLYMNLEPNFYLVKCLNDSVSQGTQAVELPYASVLADSPRLYSYMTMGNRSKNPW